MSKKKVLKKEIELSIYDLFKLMTASGDVRIEKINACAKDENGNQYLVVGSWKDETLNISLTIL